MDAFAKGQRVGVVEELHLRLACLATVDSAHARVLLVEPRALHVRLLLRIVSLRVDLADQVGNLLDALALERARVATSESLLRLLEISNSLLGLIRDLLTEVIPVLSAEVTGLVAGTVSRNDGAEALRSSLHRSIDEGELSDVILVDHAQNGLLLAHVHLRVLNFLLVRRLQLPEAVVGDEAERLLLGLTVDGSEGSRQTTRGQTVDVRLTLALDALLGVPLVGLFDGETLLVPVLIESSV